MTKLVSQLDITGRFIGSAVADPSPLEPGVYLLPGGAVDANPPDIPDGMFAQWNGSGFDLIVVPVPEPVPEPEPEPLTVAQACAEIDGIAESVRLKYITPGAGQAATYITKQIQAEKFKAAGYTGPALREVNGQIVVGYWNPALERNYTNYNQQQSYQQNYQGGNQNNQNNQNNQSSGGGNASNSNMNWRF